MPLYPYQPISGKCRICHGSFEQFQPAGDSPLKECPKCGQTVERLSQTSVHTPRILKPLSISDAKTSGFTVYKKSSKGEYERQ
ncbi:MAG: zinc ribbon domain-containing protein [Opitutales bacterium]|nr:zinc ribbon domain-containing protein [Opitutales bacterium]